MYREEVEKAQKSVRPARSTGRSFTIIWGLLMSLHGVESGDPSACYLFRLYFPSWEMYVMSLVSPYCPPSLIRPVSFVDNLFVLFRVLKN